MPTSGDIKIVRGEPFLNTVSTTAQGSGCPPFDLTNYNVSGGIKYKYTDPNLVDFSIAVNPPASSGVLTMSLTSGQTNILPISECIYYLKAYPSGDSTIVIDLLNGYADVYPL